MQRPLGLVRSKGLYRITRVYSELGGDAQALLKRHSLTEQELREPAFQMRFDQYDAFIDDLLDSCPQGELVTKFTQHYHLSDEGALGCAIMYCRDLHQMLSTMASYMSVTGPTIGRFTTGASCHFEMVVTDARAQSNVIEFEVLVVTCVLHNFANVRWGRDMPWFSRIELSFDEPERAKHYQEHFQCPIHYGQSANRFVFNSQLLHLAFMGHNYELYSVAEQQCRRQLEAISELTDTKREVVRLLSTTSGALPSFERIASLFNLSPSTLRRRLQAEGVNYKQLLRKYRIERAADLLLHTELNVQQISDMVGYQNPTNFTRAFKLELGVLPKVYRQQHTS
ncbi:helix-turn-helix transcriptional regulator [Paraferrimonas sedimenticola]|uniref:AraC family transcriptional regulator n=1 Tax=Paraferrimonas sedimenticola TaxID=375674 RepID=A0AA37RUT0_9GAMM|nr:AraC family transcriptional regulator [Paraferrimonas sedimenticola]GLP95691.1 AraC family transcriptional regulator [Paraferrimonas sedimenticola]